MPTKKQLGFAILEEKAAKHFGGAHLRNSNPKTKRPVTTSRCMHLVMRSTRASGALSLLRKDRAVREIIQKQGRKLGVRVYKVANAGNHLHLVILPSSRKTFQAFIRATSGLIARLILKVERGRPQDVQFWDQRPFSRIVEWGREYKGVCAYLLRNTLEALGFIPYKPRTKSYALG